MSSRNFAVFASRNRHKARELEALLPGWTLEPLDRDDYPPETGATYYENAASKVRFAREQTEGWVLSEDSGLEVSALGGRPGVFSARYAPEGAPAIAKLVVELDGIEDRGGTKSVTMTAPNSITAFQDAYVKKVIDTLNDQPNVLWIVSQEAPPGSEFGSSRA